MSTRSSVAVQHQDGTVSAVYCHFDGYLEGVGAALLDGHNSFDAAEALVVLGDLSAVAEKVVAYHRDRGEKFEDVKPHEYKDFEDYKSRVSEEIGDNGYRYLFRNNNWLVSQRGGAFVKLETALKGEEA